MQWNRIGFRHFGGEGAGGQAETIVTTSTRIAGVIIFKRNIVIAQATFAYPKVNHALQGTRLDAHFAAQFVNGDWPVGHLDFV